MEKTLEGDFVLTLGPGETVEGGLIVMCGVVAEVPGVVEGVEALVGSLVSVIWEPTSYRSVSWETPS